MFDSLVITLREGVEAALIVGIVAGYLRKTGREAAMRVVYWALAAAVLASIVAAFGLSRLRINEDAYEGWLMLAAAVFVASMVYWMWRTGKRMKQDIEAKLAALAARPEDSSNVALFLFVFLMVFREGIETVLFLAAVSLQTTELMNFLGGVIGLALAVALGIAFFKGSLRVNLKKFFSITAAVLALVAAQLFVSGVHELSEARVLPSSREEMKLVGPVVNNEAFFFIVVVALCIFMLLAGRIRSSTAAKSELSGPERRKALAAEHRERFWKVSATAVGLLIVVLICFQFMYSRVAQAVSPPEPLAITGGVVNIPAPELADHKLHHYAVAVGAVKVRLIAVMDDAGTVHVALDACPICGAQGYYQDGRNVICRNCSSSLNVRSIGLAGGCNPIPIHFNYKSGAPSISIEQSAVDAAAKVFR
ncbi:MAG: Fe-S-containing protein [Terriglobia bacterium]